MKSFGKIKNGTYSNKLKKYLKKIIFQDEIFPIDQFIIFFTMKSLNVNENKNIQSRINLRINLLIENTIKQNIKIHKLQNKKPNIYNTDQDSKRTADILNEKDYYFKNGGNGFGEQSIGLKLSQKEDEILDKRFSDQDSIEIHILKWNDKTWRTFCTKIIKKVSINA